MNIVFRVDASTDIGSGHVMRCLSLAKVLRERGARCFFICREHRGNLIDEIREEGFVVYELPINSGTIKSSQIYENWLGDVYSADALASISCLDVSSNDLLIVDHYAIDERWEALVRKYFKKIMVIDDLANRKHNCDYLLDQNLSHSWSNYVGLLPKKSQTFIGPKFALLRPEFTFIRHQAQAFKKKVQRYWYCINYARRC